MSELTTLPPPLTPAAIARLEQVTTPDSASLLEELEADLGAVIDVFGEVDEGRLRIAVRELFKEAKDLITHARETLDQLRDGVS